jgi:hypothetical protein
MEIKENYSLKALNTFGIDVKARYLAKGIINISAAKGDTSTNHWRRKQYFVYKRF